MDTPGPETVLALRDPHQLRNNFIYKLSGGATTLIFIADGDNATPRERTLKGDRVISEIQVNSRCNFAKLLTANTALQTERQCTPSSSCASTLACRSSLGRQVPPSGGQQRRVGWSPRRVAWSPSSSQVPPSGSQLPPRVARSPRRVARSPSWVVGFFPRRVARSSRRVARSPRRVARSPRRVARSPRRDARSPRRVARSPRRVVRSPRRVVRSQRRLLDTTLRCRQSAA